MDRDLLRQEIFKLTNEELSAKSGNPQENVFDYLAQKNFVDENGYFYLASGPIYAFHNKGGKNDIGNRILRSPRQKQLGLVQASRYVEEPFCYGEFVAIRYVYSGEVEIITPGDSFVLHQNDMFLMNAKQVLKQRLLHDEDIVFTLIIEKEYLVNHLLQRMKGGNIVANFIISYIKDNLHPEHFIIFHGGDNDELPHIMEDIVLEYIEPTEYGDLLLQDYLHILLIQMLYASLEYRGKLPGFSDMRLAQMLDYIGKNYLTVTLDDLSKHFGYNSKYISRKLKEYMGISFKDYVIDKRLEHAKLLLSNEMYSISDVISDSGFTNATFFYQKFEEKYHMTPGEYRSQVK